MSKAAISHLSRTTAAELRSSMTMFDQALGEGGARAMIGRLQGRMAEPEEMAAVVAFLLSDDASMITGTTQLADGGTVAAPW